MLIPNVRKPTTPAEMIQEYILDEYELTQVQLAESLRVSRQSVSKLLNNHSKITADMAFRLGTLTATSPEFWLNCQIISDQWESRNNSYD